MFLTISLASCAQKPTIKIVESPVQINVPKDASDPVEYPACRYEKNIDLAHCIQYTRGALDRANANVLTIMNLIGAALKASAPSEAVKKQ